MAVLLTLVAELLPAQGRGFYLTVWSCGRPACQSCLFATKAVHHMCYWSRSLGVHTHTDIPTYTDTYARL